MKTHLTSPFLLALFALVFSFQAEAGIECNANSCNYTYEMPLNQDSPELRTWWRQNFPGTPNSLCVPVSLTALFAEISRDTTSTRRNDFYSTWMHQSFGRRVTTLALRLQTDGDGTEPLNLEALVNEFTNSYEPALRRTRILTYRNFNSFREALALARQGYYISVRAGYYDHENRQNGHRFLLQSISETELSLLDPQTGNTVLVPVSNGFVSDRPLIDRLINSALVIESFEAIKP